jgi:HK97 family phage prohead protease
MTKHIDMAEFRKLAAAGAAIPTSVIRLALTGEPTVLAETRTVTFVFSDESVDCYGDTISARGWDWSAFENNPVALFGHDPSKPEYVVGKAKNLRVQGTRLIGDIEFMGADINATAESVYQMVKGGFLNAVSVGFMPLEWVATKDKSRPGGIDFKRQSLMEISIVPLPANQNALALARAAGIDVDRLGLMEGVNEEPVPVPDIAKRRSALLVRKLLGRKTKGLYDLGFFASLMSDFGYLTSWSEWEAEMEGDGSNVPDMLVSILFDMADAFMAMSQEEVSEFLSDFSSEPDVDGYDDADVAYIAAGATVAARCFRAGRVKARMLNECRVEKAGRKLSAENQKMHRDAHAAISAACDVVKGVADSADAPEPDADDDNVNMVDEQKTAADAAARARRERVAKAHKHQAAKA